MTFTKITLIMRVIAEFIEYILAIIIIDYEKLYGT